MVIRYINPFIDFGFKKLFGTEANKDILISFLNAVIENTGDPILDLFPKNVEQIGEFNGDKTCYFDVYCQTANGRRFIVEMQNSWEAFFKDRTLYYAARAIQEQGVKGDPTKREIAEKKGENETKEVELPPQRGLCHRPNELQLPEERVQARRILPQDHAHRPQR